MYVCVCHFLINVFQKSRVCVVFVFSVTWMFLSRLDVQSVSEDEDVPVEELSSEEEEELPLKRPAPPPEAPPPAAFSGERERETAVRRS